jgi:hypothetical protein
MKDCLMFGIHTDITEQKKSIRSNIEHSSYRYLLDTNEAAHENAQRHDNFLSRYITK